MKIAQVAPLYVSVPPKGYGGTERVVSYLTEALVKQGHDVTLYATGDSSTAANLHATRFTSLWKDPLNPDPSLWHTLQLQQLVNDADRYDVIHFHMDIIHLPFTRMMKTPSMTTFHNILVQDGYKELFTYFPEHPIVSISDQHRTHLPPSNWLGTVYHGVPSELYELIEKPQNYFAFVGRINEEKGPHRAADIAIACDTQLRLAFRVEDHKFWQHCLDTYGNHPLFQPIGEITDAQKGEFMGNAKALLFPIEWEEPFGMVMIEAMACGTPVIAFNRGSVKEILEDGVTGFIVNTVEEAIEAAKKIDTLDRHRIRQEFEKRFTVDVMAARYVDLYQKLING